LKPRFAITCGHSATMLRNATEIDDTAAMHALESQRQQPFVNPRHRLPQGEDTSANLARYSLGPVVEPVLVLGGTIAGCYVLYEFVIRRVRLLQPFFGVSIGR